MSPAKAPTLASIGALTSADIEVYLNGQGLATLWADGPLKVVRKPISADTFKIGKDRMVIINRSGGLPTTTEGHLAQPIFTVRCIGKQRNPDDAEALAMWVDLQLAGSPPMTLFGSKMVQKCVRAGGEPTPIMEDEAFRVHYSCSYILPSPSGF